ncbi:MAG: hypothetical protein P8Z79_24465, partial [Sedimentisphaerales bacterium]
MTRTTSGAIALLLSVLCLPACQAAGQMYFPPPATAGSHNWQTCRPEDEGVDSAKLQQAMQYLQKALDDPKTPDAKEDGTKYACVIRNGRMIWPNATTPAEQGSDLDTPCQIYSATKT